MNMNELIEEVENRLSNKTPIQVGSHYYRPEALLEAWHDIIVLLKIGHHTKQPLSIGEKMAMNLIMSLVDVDITKVERDEQ